MELPTQFQQWTHDFNNGYVVTNYHHLLLLLYTLLGNTKVKTSWISSTVEGYSTASGGDNAR